MNWKKHISIGLISMALVSCNQHHSKATIELQVPADQNVTEPAGTDLEDFFTIQEHIITSGFLRQRVINRLNTTAQVLNDDIRHMSVESDMPKLAIIISVTSIEAEKASRIALAFAEEYKAFRSEAGDETVRTITTYPRPVTDSEAKRIALGGSNVVDGAMTSRVTNQAFRLTVSRVSLME
jgi:hypothetical protein